MWMSVLFLRYPGLRTLPSPVLAYFSPFDGSRDVFFFFFFFSWQDVYCLSALDGEVHSVGSFEAFRLSHFLLDGLGLHESSCCFPTFQNILHPSLCFIYCAINDMATEGSQPALISIIPNPSLHVHNVIMFLVPTLCFDRDRDGVRRPGSHEMYVLIDDV